MKKGLLLLSCFTLMCLFNGLAQDVEIFYPSFKYDNGYGFTKHNILVGATESNLWKRAGDLPAESDLGYTPSANQRSLSSTGYDGNGTDYNITDTYAVIDAVDLTVNAEGNNTKVVFYAKTQYGLGNYAELTILGTSNYTNDPTTTSWTDLTAKVDQLPSISESNGLWTKCTIDLNEWTTASSFVLAFRYQVKNSGTVSTTDPKDRPGKWTVSELKYVASRKELTELATWQFDDFNNFEMINLVSTDAQGWKRVEALRPGLVEPGGEDYKSIQGSAVYTDGAIKSVSPTETWTVLNAVDFTGYDKGYLSFWNISQYKTGGDSDLRIKMSTNYTKNESDQAGAISAATWVDITDAFVLDESIGYDSNWISSIGEVTIDPLNPNVTFAFVYICTDTYSDVNGAYSGFRAGTWKIGDVKASVEPKATSIGGERESTNPLFYPNPVSNYLQIDRNVESLIIYSLNGAAVMNVPFPNGGVDVSSINAGIYIVRLKMKDGSMIANKLIKR